MYSSENPKSLSELKTLAITLPVFSKPNLQTAEDLKALLQGYFGQCISLNRPPTMTGISKILNISRNDFLQARHHDPEFQHIIDVAKLSIIEYVEEMLLMGKASINLIFWLKNNAGWIDKTEITTHNKTAAEILHELEQSGQIINAENSINNINQDVQSLQQQPT